MFTDSFEYVLALTLFWKKLKYMFLKQQRETEATTDVSFQLPLKKAIFCLVESMIIT